MIDLDNGSSAGVSARLAAGHDAIDDAQALAGRFVQDAGLAPRAEAVLSLVLEELITNVITHGGAAGEDALLVELRMEGEVIALTFEDNGVAFDPRDERPPDPRDTDYADALPGGLGWPLVLNHFSIADYWRMGGRMGGRTGGRTDGCNRLVLHSMERWS